MASPYAVYRDLLQEAGAIQVHSLTDLIDAAQVLSVAPTPRVCGEHGGVSVFSIPGGTRAMTADALEQEGVPLATFARSTVQALAAALPEFGGTENPTDLTGQVLSHPGLFDRCLDLIADDPNTEALIVQVANRGPRDVSERVDLLGRVAARTGVPVIASFLGDAMPAAERLRLRAHGVVCARDPVEAARYLGWLWRSRAVMQKTPEPQGSAPALGDTTPPRTWAEMTELLARCGIAVPGWRIVDATQDPAQACQGLRFPVAVKALPEDVDHKTELGLVRLNIEAQALVHAVQDIRVRLGTARARVLVQEMDPGGVEVLLSALHNEDFGPILALGSGGVATELDADVAYVALPTTPERIGRALQGLKLARRLEGFRGQAPADAQALQTAACALGEQFLGLQGARELEINPLFVHTRGSGRLVAVDALVKT
jgi:acyl-CoA synthetase (NDP forming)